MKRVVVCKATKESTQKSGGGAKRCGDWKNSTMKIINPMGGANSKSIQ